MTSTPASTNAAPAETGERGVIHTEDLTKVYPGADFTAVDKLNLDVHAGEIFGLLGPNGAGKTTTAGMLTTRVVPTSGKAFLAGVDVGDQPALAKQLSGIVSQQNTLDRQLTVWENLYFHGRLFGIGAKESRQIADALLARFQLTKWAKASVYALSGGMAQRLMVARAIFHRPSVLFLDEPTAGLDPQSRLALWDLLHELHNDGQTILLTTHYMEEADQLCDRVAIMDHGRVLALDTPANLKRRSAPTPSSPCGPTATSTSWASCWPRTWPGSPGPARPRAGSNCTCRASTGWCRASCSRPSAAASTCSTCRSPSPAWRPSSST
jgi:ABC-2 type transport system ATP-binding protein